MKRNLISIASLALTIIAITAIFIFQAKAVEASDDDEVVKQIALERVIAPELGKPVCETGYQIGEFRRAGRWVLLTIVCWPTEQTDPDVFVPETIFFSIAKRVGGGWLVYVEGEPEFVEVIVSAPKSVIDPDAKAELIAQGTTGQVDSTAVTAAYTTGLPWQPNTTWYYRTSIHGGNNALDFASPCGQVGNVMAADKGTVVWAYSTCMLVKRPDGLQVGYQHLAPSNISVWKAGMWVNKGQFLGKTTLTSGCSGNTYAQHVHFWLQGVYPNGSKFGGWVLQNPYLTKPGQSKYPNLSCVASNAILYNPNDEGGPIGYTFCAYEGGYCSFSGTREVAYGAQGSFNHKYNVVGGIACNNSVFGDPLVGVPKACYYK